MSVMAYGEYRHSIDAKNRLMIPACLRERLGTNLVITKPPRPDQEKCIFLYSEERWDEICDEIYNLSPDVDSRRRQRAILSTATPVETDKTGRITLSQTLKDFAGIDKDIVIVGTARRVEIWAKEEWDKESEAFDEYLKAETSVRF